MMRRTLPHHDRLVLVESPNKCAKITQILQSNVKDWTFGLSHLKAAAGPGGDASSGRRELVAVKPTIGHFMTVQDLDIRRAPFGFTPITNDDAANVTAAEEDTTTKGKKKKVSAGGKKAAEKKQASALLELPPLPADSPLLTFLPNYELSKDNRSMPDVLQYIQANRAHINEIILAPDPDREGELIAVHALRFLQKKLNSGKGSNPPILFSRAYIQAITDEGVIAAMKKRQLNYCDFSLAEAASARHSMDRIFGWVGSTTMRGVDPSFVSIGRVQTPALILVRGQELKADKVQKEHKASFVVQGKLSVMAAVPSASAGSGEGTAPAAAAAPTSVVLSKSVTFTLQQPTSTGSGASMAAAAGSGSSSSFATMDEAKAWLASFEGKGEGKKEKEGSSPSITTTPAAPPSGLVATLLKAPQTSRTKQSAPPPFTMQSLLTGANAQLRIGTEGVTAALQDLFQAGLITYPRTDSTRIDDSFVVEKLKPYILKEFGKGMFVNRQVDEEVAASKKSSSSSSTTTDTTAPVDAPKKKKKKGEENIEDAHEALRPTSMDKHPASPELVAAFQVAGGGGSSNIRSPHAYPIYKMIFRATVAAFMTQSESESVTVSIGLQPATSSPGDAMLVAKVGASRVIAPGWKAAKRLEVTGSSASAAAAAKAAAEEAAAEGGAGEDDEEELDPSKISTFEILKNIVVPKQQTEISKKKKVDDGSNGGASSSVSSLITRVALPTAAAGSSSTNGGNKTSPPMADLPLSIIVEDLKASEKPLVLPKKFTEGTLIQELKNYGVGRPSTYASILKTLFARKYIYSDTQGRLHTTDVGQGVVNAAQNVFPALVDINFTAKFEEELDQISTFRGEGGGSEGSSSSSPKTSAATKKKSKASSDALLPSDPANRDLGEGNNPLSCYTLSRFTYALKGMVQDALLRSKLITYYRRELVRGIGAAAPAMTPSSPTTNKGGATPADVIVPSLTASIFEGCDERRRENPDKFSFSASTMLSSSTPDGALMRKAVLLKTAAEIPLLAEIDRREKTKSKSVADAAAAKVKQQQDATSSTTTTTPSSPPPPVASATLNKTAAYGGKFAGGGGGSPFDPHRFTLNALSATIKGLLTREGGLQTMKMNHSDMTPGRLFRSEEDKAVLFDTKFPPIANVTIRTTTGATSSSSSTSSASASPSLSPHPPATIVKINKVDSKEKKPQPKPQKEAPSTKPAEKAPMAAPSSSSKTVRESSLPKSKVAAVQPPVVAENTQPVSEVQQQPSQQPTPTAIPTTTTTLPLRKETVSLNTATLNVPTTTTVDSKEGGGEEVPLMCATAVPGSELATPPLHQDPTPTTSSPAIGFGSLGTQPGRQTLPPIVNPAKKQHQQQVEDVTTATTTTTTTTTSASEPVVDSTATSHQVGSGEGIASMSASEEVVKSASIAKEGDADAVAVGERVERPPPLATATTPSVTTLATSPVVEEVKSAPTQTPKPPSSTTPPATPTPKPIFDPWSMMGRRF